EIINRIIAGVSNDKKWLSSEKVLERGIDKISKEIYMDWFEKLDEKVKKELEKQWGKAPGEFMIYDGFFPVPGILNGNVF
ncbi:cobaltochelatase subunit CobN, partial [Acinetobacter sp. 163]|nr:cobaltochelatase subunit CobN [Acinetobacter sp. 163]